MHSPAAVSRQGHSLCRGADAATQQAPGGGLSQQIPAPSSASEANCPGMQQLAVSCKVSLPDSKHLVRAQVELLTAGFGDAAFHRPKLFTHCPLPSPHLSRSRSLTSCVVFTVGSWHGLRLVIRKVSSMEFDPVGSGPTHSGVDTESVVGPDMNVSTSSEAGYC